MSWYRWSEFSHSRIRKDGVSFETLHSLLIPYNKVAHIRGSLAIFSVFFCQLRVRFKNLINSVLEIHFPRVTKPLRAQHLTKSPGDLADHFHPASALLPRLILRPIDWRGSRNILWEMMTIQHRRTTGAYLTLFEYFCIKRFQIFAQIFTSLKCCISPCPFFSFKQMKQLKDQLPC